MCSIKSVFSKPGRGTKMQDKVRVKTQAKGQTIRNPHNKDRAKISEPENTNKFKNQDIQDIILIMFDNSSHGEQNNSSHTHESLYIAFLISW